MLPQLRHAASSCLSSSQTQQRTTLLPPPPSPLLPAAHTRGQQSGSGAAPSLRLKATRDVDFAYQKDIQTKLKPGEFLERTEDRSKVVYEAQDWRVVAAMFGEMGADIERRPGLISDMLAALQRLVPQQQQQSVVSSSSSSGGLSQQDAAALAINITKMSLTLVENVTKLSTRAFSTAVWALATLPDPAKTLGTPAAKTARSRTVAALGAYAIGTINRMKADEMFHLLAGLHLLGFKAPDRLDPKPRVGRDGKLVVPAPGRPGAPKSFGALLESRSIKMMMYLEHKTVADAAFVVSRMVPAAAMTPEWLRLFEKASKQHLAEMQPEALVHSGYALARNGHLPSNSYRKAFIRALQEHAAVLTGEEFPMALFTLARWQQQELKQQQEAEASGQPAAAAADDDDDDDEYDESAGGSYGGSYYDVSGLGDDDGLMMGAAAPPQPRQHPAAVAAAAAAAAAAASGKQYNPATAPTQELLDELLLASYSNRALKDLPLGQIAVILKSLAGLQGLIGVSVNPMWLKRVWPAVNAKIDAAAGVSVDSGSANTTSSSSSIAADLADLLAALPLLNPRPQLPQDFVEGLVGNMGVGLQQVSPSKLAAACYALQQLQHVPDAIFVRQAQAALLAAVPAAGLQELPQLLKAGLAVATVTDTAAAAAAASSNSASSSSASSGASSGASIKSGAEFAQAFVQAATDAFQARLQAATAAVGSTVLPIGSSSSSSGAGSRAVKEQLQTKQQEQRVEAVQAADRQNLWTAPRSVLAMLAATATALAAAKADSSSGSTTTQLSAVLQGHIPALQRLWQTAAVGVAAVAPTEQLIGLLNELVDLPQANAQLLGLAPDLPTAAALSSELAQASSSGGDLRSRHGAMLAVLRASVLAGTQADKARKSKTKAAAAAAATAHQLKVSAPAASFAYSFSVDDADQLLLVLSDSGFAPLQKQLPQLGQILAAAADVLNGALASDAASDKGPAYGLPASSEQARNLMTGLTDDWPGAAPARLQKKFDEWLPRAQAAEAAAEAQAQAEAEAAAAAEAEAYGGGRDPYSHFGGGRGGGQGRQPQQQDWRQQQQQDWQQQPFHEPSGRQQQQQRW